MVGLLCYLIALATKLPSKIQLPTADRTDARRAKASYSFLHGRQRGNSAQGKAPSGRDTALLWGDMSRARDTLEAAIVGLATAVLREFAGRLQTFEALSDETSHQLKAARLAAAERYGSAEPLLDCALASLEHLDEVAKAMMRGIDALLGA